jgi:hypothetical protein
MPAAYRSGFSDQSRHERLSSTLGIDGRRPLLSRKPNDDRDVAERRPWLSA